MGSLFTPSMPRYSPVNYVSQASEGGQTTENYSAIANKAEGQQQPNESDEKSVRDMIRRNARGRNSLIQTSYRGVLTDINSLAPQRKNLLGE